MSNLHVEDQSLQASQYQMQKPIQNKYACSTKYSTATGSKFINNPDNQSVSYSLTSKGAPSSNKRKEQNKESAKKCRIRKKEKQQELTEKEKDLQYELARLKYQNDKAKFELDNYIRTCSISNLLNTERKAQAFNRLNKLIEVEDMADEDQINLILDNIKNKIGATGTQRQAKIIYIFKQIVHICFPALHRYFMWAAHNGNHCFGTSQSQSSWIKGLSSILNLTEQQKEFIRNKKKNFQIHYQTFSELIDEMKQTKAKMEKESAKLEGLIEELRYLLTPVQCVKLITFIENNKYKNEMQMWDKRNIRKFSEYASLSDSDPGCFKRPKLE